ncbi:methionyl-tRNA formyltransferase [Mesoplasma coleopterae]|uniref:Methionyl-tRNA formyltransferase n=1 Tax=Mesoplasma coleopterae TaxID=324078 RepID=A0A2K8P2I2_9MOLU|nr:methionyl-tRNA formyltransferase [Mesoplasma coleopterae]ATZ20939.1 methionyl-tRNA formyltransferase [Mesoplasma coleopterae]AVN63117.1 methionyl-tRNA formyltransferase [Mesoplasma coleopterae]
MEKIKVIFCGTPQIGADILTALTEMENVEIVLVISQPDRPVGRKKELKPTPVKEVALLNNLKIIQPVKISEAYDEIAKIESDFIVTCAYGQFVPTKILDLPRIDSINIHGSLLPKYRGGAPIQYAIKNGDSETGISIMKMVKKMDAGDYYIQESIKIEDCDDTGTMFEKLAKLGQKMIKENLVKIYNNELRPIAQNEDQVTFSKNISTEEERINWDDSTVNVWNHIRSLSPWPIAHTFKGEERYKIQKVKILNNNVEQKPGTIVDINENGINVQTNNGQVQIQLIQKPGKKMMEASAYKLTNLSDLKVGDYFE